MYVYYGSLKNGNYFWLCEDDLLICDSDPAEVYTEEFFEKTDGDTYDWEQEHVINMFMFPLQGVNPTYPEGIVKETFEILKRKYSGIENHLHSEEFFFA